jgi:hypothetical protein
MTYSRVKKARLLQDYVVEFTFRDGTKRQIDLDIFLRGPLFESLRSPDAFSKFKIDKEGGTIVWPNGADIAPETLYFDLGPVPIEERTH